MATLSTFRQGIRSTHRRLTSTTVTVRSVSQDVVTLLLGTAETDPRRTYRLVLSHSEFADLVQAHGAALRFLNITSTP